MKEYYKKHRIEFIWVGLLSVVLAAAIVGISIVLQHVVDWAMAGQVKNAVLLSVAFVAGLGFIYWLQVSGQVHLNTKVMKEIRENIVKKVLAKSTAEFKEHDETDYISLVQNDVKKVEDTYIDTFFTCIAALTQLTFAIIVMTGYSPVFTITMLGMTAAMFVVPAFFSKKLEKATKNVSDAQAELTSGMSEVVYGFEVTRSFHKEEYREKKFSVCNNALKKAARKLDLFGKSVLIECIEERIRIKFFYSVNALVGPLSGKEHKCAAHCGNACRIADSLTLDLLVALLVITYVVDIVSLICAIFLARKDAADVCLAVRAGTKACRIREKSLEELDRNDLVAFKLNGSRREHANVFEALHVSEIALSECHEETDPLNFRNVYGQRFKLFVMQKIHILHSDGIEIVFPLDAHRGDLYPLAVLDIASGRGNLAEIYFRVEVCCERIAVIAAIAVKDIDRVDRVELMLFCISAVSLCNAGIEAAAEKSRKSGLLELLFICPLPAVIEVCREALLFASLLVDLSPLGIVRILRFVVCSIHIVDAADEAGVHDRKILVRKRDVHDQIGLI